MAGETMLAVRKGLPPPQLREAAGVPPSDTEEASPPLHRQLLRIWLRAQSLRARKASQLLPLWGETRGSRERQ